MRRRRYLQASVSALLVFGAGCSFQQEQPIELSIIGIEIENLASKDVKFTVEVLTAAETVFKASRVISANDAVVIEQPVDKPGVYTLEITTSDQTATQDLSLRRQE